MPATIDDDFNFFAKSNDRCVVKYTSALKHYSAGFDAAIKLENGIPIFLDANVLLRTYSSSFSDREKLKTFFNENKTRIYITHQVRHEFIKNREGVIEDFYNNITGKILDKFQSEVVNRVSGYFEQNKLILKDYPEIRKKVEKINKEVSALHAEMVKTIKASPQAKKEIKFVDDILDIFAEFNYLDILPEEELDFLKKGFDSHRAEFTPENVAAKLAKVGVAFPGIADIKEKPDDPYGDFIIFHEVMKYVKENNQDVVIITYDTTKGDWLHFNGEPHLHYVINCYLNTGKSIFVLDAKRILQGLLEISPTSLTEIVEEDKQQENLYSNTLFLKPLLNEISSKTKDEIHEMNMKFIKNYVSSLGDVNPGEKWALSAQEYVRELSREAKMKALRDALFKTLENRKEDGDEDESQP